MTTREKIALAVFVVLVVLLVLWAAGTRLTAPLF